MPLSISNSDERLHVRRWGRVWLLALATVALLLTGWETFWRMQGFRPSVQDDWGLWAKMREKAADRGDKAVILAGASRIQTGLHPETFAEIAGIYPVMLAIDGSNPIPVLQDLAKDPRITGTVVCSFIPIWLGEESEHFGRAARWIEEYHDRKWSKRIETELTVLLQQHLAFRYTGLQPGEIWAALQDGRWPRIPYAPMRANRFRPADFSLADVERVREGRIEREKEFHAKAEPMSEKQFMEKVRRIDGIVKQIKNRGGNVVFVRFPSSGLVRKLESRSWPREKYWDVLAANTQAFSIHYEDYPSLSGFECPDGSHLDIGDAEAFTRALAEILSENRQLR